MHFSHFAVFLVAVLGNLHISCCMEITKIQIASDTPLLVQPNTTDGNGNGSTKIVGGEEANLHEFPWLIRIQGKSSKSLLCGGTILDHDLIMTASHCIGNPKEDAKTYEILAGAHDMNAKEDMRQIKNIKRINVHKEYDGNTFQNDIALIKLASNLTWTNAVMPVSLANASSTIPSFGTTAGWGVTDDGLLSSRLRKVSVPIVSNKDCSVLYNSTGFKITDSMMCAGISGKDSCQGDSGGGLICSSAENKTFVCGIVSFGAGCGLPGFPGVYTNVGSYRKWIAENSGKSLPLVPMIIILGISFSTLFARLSQ